VAKKITNKITYQLGVLVAAFILLDQTVTDLWIDLNASAPGQNTRAPFMRDQFGGKIRKLKSRIATVFKGHPSLAPKVGAWNLMLDRAAEVANRRNDVIHGHCCKHKHTGELYLVNLSNRGPATIRLDALQISEVSDAITDVALALVAESSNVRTALQFMQSADHGSA